MVPEQAADDLLLTREAITCVAQRHGMVACFLPKLSVAQAGSGAHMHFSICKVRCGDPSQPYKTPLARCASIHQGYLAQHVAVLVRDHSIQAAEALPCMQDGRNLFEGWKEGGEGLADAFLAGAVAHLPALQAFTVPTPLGYERMKSGTAGSTLHRDRHCSLTASHTCGLRTIHRIAYSAAMLGARLGCVHTGWHSRVTISSCCILSSICRAAAVGPQRGLVTFMCVAAGLQAAGAAPSAAGAGCAHGPAYLTACRQSLIWQPPSRGPG